MTQKRILEAGHYYLAKGPTVWSAVGWQVMEQIKKPTDQTMLFLDDVHALEYVSEVERQLPVQPDFTPTADFVVYESAQRINALQILDRLRNLPNKCRAKQNGDGKWFCSGFALTNEHGDPLCVLLDAGLTLCKQQLGFSVGVNILPIFCQPEQENLLRLVKKVIPGFSLQVVLYDLDGTCSSLS